MNFWPFPLVRNYSTCPRVDVAVRAVMSKPGVVFVRSDGYRETYASSGGELTFWVVNRYYAYASEGSFKTPDGATFVWKDAMPSRATVRWLRGRQALALGGTP